MAKRTAQLAGLAALGALGYMLTRDRKGPETPSPGALTVPSTAQEETRAVDRGDDRDIGGGVDLTSGPMRTIPRPARRPAPVAPAADVAPAAPTAPADVFPGRSTGRGGPTAAEIAAYEAELAASSGPNISADVARRTGVKLNSPAGAGRSAGRGGPTMAELAAYEASRAAGRRDNRFDLSTPEGRKRAEQAQALEGVYPETMVAAPGLKTVAAFAKGLANRAPRLVEMTQEALAAPVRRLPAPTYLLKKKGGTVSAKPKKMASGGMTSKVSSASKRGDGIAQRGKTKGKMY